MQLDIDGSSLVRRSAVRRHVETAVSRWLGPFADRIATVRVRLRERAPSEATRTLCGIAVTLEPPDRRADGWVLARAEDNDPRVAVNRAVERIAKAVGEEIARRDRRQELLARAVLPLAQGAVVERV